MLLVMTFNGWVILSVTTGLAIGYAFTGVEGDFMAAYNEYENDSKYIMAIDNISMQKTDPTDI